MNKVLTHPTTLEEVWGLFSTRGLLWYVISTKLQCCQLRRIHIVKFLLETGNFPNSLGHTTSITMIPKVLNTIMHELRPISIYNFTYKVNSKLLGNILKSLFSDMITMFQSVFDADRLIQDNILVSHEAFH